MGDMNVDQIGKSSFWDSKDLVPVDVDRSHLLSVAADVEKKCVAPALAQAISRHWSAGRASSLPASAKSLAASSALGSAFTFAFASSDAVASGEASASAFFVLLGGAFLPACPTLSVKNTHTRAGGLFF